MRRPRACHQAVTYAVNAVVEQANTDTSARFTGRSRTGAPLVLKIDDAEDNRFACSNVT